MYFQIYKYETTIMEINLEISFTFFYRSRSHNG